MRRMGDSVDWTREYFTMDDKLSKTVTETFVRLYQQGLIYRGKRLVNWDPILQSAVSDLEVESEEEDGSLWHIAYPLVNGEGDLTVATTRPETLLGHVAVMVHPEDERYTHLIGQYVRLPLCEREIPVIAVAYVDKAFGTGVVKVTPAHDPNDYAVGQRHQLPIIGVLTLDAKINENAPEKYHGLDRFVARKQVVADLEAAGLLVEVKKHKLMVPRCARTGQVVEPMLTDQWFVAMTKPGRDGRSIAENDDAFGARGEFDLGHATAEGIFDQLILDDLRVCPGEIEAHAAVLGLHAEVGIEGDLLDQGAKMLSSVCASIAAKDEKEIAATLQGITDPVGTFYRYGLAKSLLRRKVGLPAEAPAKGPN